jgi:hypothetical protein
MDLVEFDGWWLDFFKDEWMVQCIGVDGGLQWCRSSSLFKHGDLLQVCSCMVVARKESVGTSCGG